MDMRRLMLLVTLWLALVNALAGRVIAEESSEGTAEASAADGLNARLAVGGFTIGAPVFIRIFKAASTLEVWLERQGRFSLFARYPICRWSGELGPKLSEGDRQSPEGVYFVDAADLIVNARWHRAINLGFPNSRDRALGLTGSGILIHGKCSSEGCFALTDPIVEDVYTLVAAALAAGQRRITVHVFPFELTRAALAAHAESEWHGFWRELKVAHDLFLRDGLPARPFLCNGRYMFQSRRERAHVAPAVAKVCTPLEAPPKAFGFADSPRRRADRAMARPARVARTSATQASSPAEEAKSCNPSELRCRQLRRALASPVPCPRKFARCRNAATAAVKSIDCPLKYPRCRRAGGRVTSQHATANDRGPPR